MKNLIFIFMTTLFVSGLSMFCADSRVAYSEENPDSGEYQYEEPQDQQIEEPEEEINPDDYLGIIELDDDENTEENEETKDESYDE